MRVTILALAASAMLSGAKASEPDALVGTWLTEGGDSKIRLSPCGRTYCGTLLWAKDNNLLDEHNPDRGLRRRSIIGIPLTRDMRPDDEGNWAGSIYNPENGKTYEITMRVKGRDRLEVEGCVLGMLCGSELWSRQLDDVASAARPN